MVISSHRLFVSSGNVLFAHTEATSISHTAHAFKWWPIPSATCPFVLAAAFFVY